MKFSIFPIIAVLLFSCKAKKDASTNDITKPQEELVETQKAESKKDPVVNTVGDANYNSRKLVDWVGSYSGMLPCEDCEGIQTTLTLNSDLTFIYTSQQIGKSEEIEIINGHFEWDLGGRYITLKHKIGNHFNYIVSEGVLKQLGRNAEMITSKSSERYNLYKIKNPLVGRYWKLIELNGQAIEQTKNMKEPHIKFTNDLQVNGTGGCNSFFSSFDAPGKLQLRFGEFGMTEMACSYDNYDQLLVEALKMTENYVIAGEDELRLQIGKRMAHARFKAIYF